MGPNLPPGTRVVTRAEIPLPDSERPLPAGAVGVIVRQMHGSEPSYRVRFPEGSELTVAADALTLLKRFREGALATVVRGPSLERFVIYRCVVGSRAFGLDVDESDVDRRGIYLPPAELHWSLWGSPEQLENHETQETYWEIEKFLKLALKANPNVLECLQTPLVEMTTPLADELRSMREAFLSKLVYQTYNGYVLSQFKKLQQDLRTRGEIRWKHAMHLVRLLLSGIHILESGEVLLDVGDHRERLLAIRAGELTWEEIDAWRLELHTRFDEALRGTRLPEGPDYERVNAFLVRARRQAVAAPWDSSGRTPRARRRSLDTRTTTGGSEAAVPDASDGVTPRRLRE